MNIDDKLQTVRALVAETEAKDQQTWAIVRGTLGEIEEELRTLRAEVAMQKIETFSEEEFATWLGASLRTVQRIRLRNPQRVKPIMLGIVPRYSTWHQLHAHEIFPPEELGKKQKAGGRRPAAARTELRAA